jgi:hypothetical protein
LLVIAGINALERSLQEEWTMKRNLLLFGIVAAFGVLAVVAGAGDSTQAVACDETAKAASVSSCCAKSADATTAAATAVKSSSCVKGAQARTASVSSGCTRGATVHTAAMNASAGCAQGAAVLTAGAGCDKSAAVAAGGSSCARGAAVAAGGDACCKSGAAATASKEACKEVCDEAKTAAVLKAAVDELPYRENKRVVLTGAYVCGSCQLHVTEGCSPLFKTADGKVYPLIQNPEATRLRQADAGKGVEIASTVKKLDGVKYLEVKSYKTL